jgi:hypothetical protein
MASVELVIRVVQEFDDLGGASPELVAWELGADADSVKPLWDRAIADGLLAPAPRDRIFGEEMWRLTARGRSALSTDLQPVTNPA